MEKRIIKILQVISAVILVLGIAASIKTCTREKRSPIEDRLEEMNDSLMKEMMENSIKIDSLYLKIDSLDLISDTLFTNQPIINEYYRQEVYNILNADARGANRKLAEVLKVSDSLLKAGFFSRTINIPNELN